MRTIRIVFLLLLTATAIQAQQRVFVSALNGDDSGPCSVNAPCRSFAKALTLVATAGEVLALDSGGFGPITITKAVSIVAPRGVEGTISQGAVGLDAITINAPGAVVVLRGLTVFGLGTGNDGVNATAVSALIVDSCNFIGFATFGILFNLSSAGTMSIYNSAFHQNWQAVETLGQTADLARFLIRDSRLENNTYGLSLYEGSRGTISESSLSHNTYNGISVTTELTGQTATLDVDRCVISGNGVDGILASSGVQTGVETVRVAASVIVNNTVLGLQATDATAHIATRGDNTVQDNGSNGAFTDTFTVH